jgi:hypothetical protein
LRITPAPRLEDAYFPYSSSTTVTVSVLDRVSARLSAGRLSLDPPRVGVETLARIHEKGLLSWDNDGVLRRLVDQARRHFQ